MPELNMERAQIIWTSNDSYNKYYTYGNRYEITIQDKEVFVKHEQAPTAPKLEGVWVFVDFK